jgi:hypothetical protein
MLRIDSVMRVRGPANKVTVLPWQKAAREGH